ncbi:OmpA family protein [Aquimonas sp.]|jgi:OOP family OmpA-OmpF porin|uniref:OmpA family protein n=1 Tax=Aquimonas sp. TaxID=1872588 RepID=UPI0037BF8ACC
MKKKLLCCAVLTCVGFANVSFAQDSFDDRWYVGGSVGFVEFDDARGLKDDLQLGANFGKFFTPNWSLDLELKHINPQLIGNSLNWSQYGLGATGRYHFRDAGDTWGPYLALGAGVWRHEREFSNPAGGRPGEVKGNNLELHAGVGIQADFGRANVRAELGGRYDMDDTAISGEDNFFDKVFTVGLMVPLGAGASAPVEAQPAAPAPAPATPVVNCADLDDDGDGVNNCEDKCPNSTPGQTVGPDGCPVPVTIDLRGVNFDFDKATLRPDAVSTLNEVVSILRQYSDIRVEVAGHTDLCGAEGYNQALSENRAKAVHDFLTSNGISAGRLVGPRGYGESRPLAPTGQNLPECKNETNRRTELNVQN